VSADIQALHHDSIYKESSRRLDLIQTHGKLPVGSLKLNSACFLCGHTACLVSVFSFKERRRTLLITILSVCAPYAIGGHRNPVHSNFLQLIITTWRMHEFVI
jgi:hypothetical protein